MRDCAALSLSSIACRLVAPVKRNRISTDTYEHVLVWTRVNIPIRHLTDFLVNIYRRMTLAGVNGFSKKPFCKTPQEQLVT